MSRFILILVAFSVLNQSIDLDYLTSAFRPVKSAEYDDVDTIAEYVIEHLMDDEDFIPDNDDDSNSMPVNKGVDKSTTAPLYWQPAPKIVLAPHNNADRALQAALQQARATCKGYFNIVSPPPDASVA